MSLDWNNAKAPRVTSSFVTKGSRIVWIGFAVLIAILGVAAAFLILSLPDANAFNAQDRADLCRE